MENWLMRFVAKEADRIVGFVTLKVNNNNGNIGLIAIGKNAQGKGLGTQLINVCENYLNKCSVETLTVPTQLDNLQACKFYKNTALRKIASSIFIIFGYRKVRNC